MRKITRQIVSAFLDRRPARKGGTKTDGRRLWVGGNCIAERRADGIYITNAGWNTTVIRERLSGIPGVKLRNKNRICHLNGRPWGGDWTKVPA